MSEAAFLNAVGLFLLGLVRISGFYVNLPAFGETTVPNRIKAGLAGLTTLLILPHLIRTQKLPDLSVLGYGFMGFQEMILGITMGFVVLVTIDALKFGGEIMGMQIGFSFIQVVDPESSRSQAVLAEFFQVMVVLLFLMMNGHAILLQAFIQSFDLIPIVSTQLPAAAVEEVVRLTATIFALGLQIAMPIVSVMLVSDIALGIIARTVPRMNIFQVGFAIKILLGFTTLIMLLPFISDFMKDLIQQVYGQVDTILKLMAPK
ncbi:MAG: flagellar biosynthetic protein FliR [Candidatus Riflebacteria bacterium]|nr:flagellar biosynthetic protein FliR [Candidatus Riflebacteria bacterium]